MIANLSEYLIQSREMIRLSIVKGTGNFAAGCNRQIFVYTFCLINICLSLSDDANKIKTLNIERE